MQPATGAHLLDKMDKKKLTMKSNNNGKIYFPQLSGCI